MNSPLTASERLALSREHLHNALSELAFTSGKAAPGTTGNSFAVLLANLKSATSVRLMQLVVRNWWHQHPLRGAMKLSADAAEIVVQPVAQTHPLALVLGSAVAGALLFRTRPWRWVPASALLAGLLPRLLSALNNPNKLQH